MLPEIFDRVEELVGKNPVYTWKFQREMLMDVDTVTNAVYAIIYPHQFENQNHLGNPTAIANAQYMAKQYMDIRCGDIKANFDEDAEKGSAKLVLELKNGVITVRHGESNQVLVDFLAVDGDWKAITNAINKIVEDRGEKWFI